MKEYKLNFECNFCKATLQIVVKVGMYGKKSVLRCRKCEEITSVQVPVEQVFIDNDAKRKKASSESPKTEIKSNFKTEKFLRLEIVSSEGSVASTFVDIDQQQMTIGRKNNSGASLKPDIEVTNNDNYMSKKHVVIVRKENKSFVIKDLNSTNGTWVNGEKLNPNDEIYIEDGDEIKIGRTYFKTKIIEDNISTNTAKPNPNNLDGTWIG